MGMFGGRVGYATVKADITRDDVIYPFGPLSDIAGKRLQVLERNRDGDCLCLVNNGAGMADISARHIEKYENV